MLRCLRSPLSRAPCEESRIQRNIFCLALPLKRLSTSPQARCLRTSNRLHRGVNSSFNPRSTTTPLRLLSRSFPRHGVAGGPSSVDTSVEERRRRPDAPIGPPALLARSITPGYCLAIRPPPPSVARPEFSRPRKCRATQHFPAPMEALGSTLGMPNLPASGVQRGGPQVSTLPPPLPRRPPVYARIRPRTTLLSTSASGRRSAGRYASCRPYWSLSLTLCS